jgi:prepilin-type processing-associated H-X9-DG protein
VKLWPYTHNYQMFICPSRGNGKAGAKRLKDLTQDEGREDCDISSYYPGAKDMFKRVSYTYKNELAFRTGSHESGALEVELISPSRLPMMWDGDRIWSFVNYTGGEWVQPSPESGHSGGCWPPAFQYKNAQMRHNGGLNMAFADGHVKYVAWEDMHQAKYCLRIDHAD